MKKVMLVIGDVQPLYYRYAGEAHFSNSANGIDTEVPMSFVLNVVTLFPGEGFRNLAKDNVNLRQGSILTNGT